MSSAMRVALVALVAISMASGCVLPSTKVVKNPTPNDKGVRYYRPKPYLFIKPMVNQGGVVDGYVTLDQVYMPDFTEEYSIHIRSGLGINHTSFKLQDGWNLTEFDVNIDSQFNENVSAIADLMRSIPQSPAGGGAPGSMTVRATNVPMGLYEAVVSRGGDGKKRLYGFRYVGFMPYEPCPVESGGVQCQDCYSGALYGLVFEDGAMIFRPLPEIPNHILKEKAGGMGGPPGGVEPGAPKPAEPAIKSEEISPLGVVQ